MTDTCKACGQSLPANAFAFTDRSHRQRRDVCRVCNRRAGERRKNAQRRRESFAHAFDTEDWTIRNLRSNACYEWKPTKRDLLEQAACRVDCGMAW